MSSALITLTEKLASKLDMGTDGAELVTTLKATAFKGNVSDSQMTALMVVANQYGLNPWTKEIYAFPDKNNGIVPVVGVDGWARIINNHPQFDGMEFEDSDEKCTCIIYRKDRQRPVRITEYLSECKRNTGPWNSHPRRMLRHKAMIQCARLAFGYTGIHDTDEAQGIVEKDITPKPEIKSEALRTITQEPVCDVETGEENHEETLNHHVKMIEQIETDGALQNYFGQAWRWAKENYTEGQPELKAAYDARKLRITEAV